MEAIDTLRIELSSASLLTLRVALATIMFGIALDVRFSDFKYLITRPKPVVVGAIGQLIALPAMTFAFVSLIDLNQSIALGLIVIAACPGGNMSNLFSYLAGANIALSVALTSLSTLASIAMTPFNISFWSNLYLENQSVAQTVRVDMSDTFSLFFFVIALPLAAGLLAQRLVPQVAAAIKKPFKVFSVLFLIGFIIVAVVGQWDLFINYVHLVAGIVFLHGLCTVLLGYGMGKVSGLEEKDCRTLSIELGIQNSGLGIAIILDFFKGIGGMALTAASWGIIDFFMGIGLVGIFKAFGGGRVKKHELEKASLGQDVS